MVGGGDDEWNIVRSCWPEHLVTTAAAAAEPTCSRRRWSLDGAADGLHVVLARARPTANLRQDWSGNWRTTTTTRPRPTARHLYSRPTRPRRAAAGPGSSRRCPAGPALGGPAGVPAEPLPILPAGIWTN